MKVKIISRNHEVTAVCYESMVTIGKTYKVIRKDGDYYNIDSSGYEYAVHKSDCEVITDKEIIGYKLKDEYRDNKRVIKAACNIDGYENFGESIRDGQTIYNDVSKLKESGVLDLWFEPVYKEETKLEAGKWYINKKRPLNIIFITEIEDQDNFTLYGFSGEGIWRDETKCFRDGKYKPATDKEVEQALIKEAKKRGFKEGVSFRYPDKLSLGVRTIKSKVFEYTSSLNTLCDSITRANIFQEGKWAEIISKPELPEINGYKGEYNSGIIEYGCAKLPEDWFSAKINRSIKSMVLDSGVEINETHMNQIREYLNDKS